MISVTTPTLENGVIVEYKGIVTGEIVAGINFLKDFGASIRNIIGGRSAGYEEELVEARNNALREMEAKAAQIGANAVVGVKIDYESFGNAGMIMVIATGTAVVVQNK
ncbi:MAG: YbjQ family protein [Eubacterium sp.]|nr:YbjQ family protein [Clostridiales bacterium]MDE6723006.1 YbjQ family protein [Eubacterium sp.]